MAVVSVSFAQFVHASEAISSRTKPPTIAWIIHAQGLIAGRRAISKFIAKYLKLDEWAGVPSLEGGRK